MSLTYERDRDWIKLNQRARYLLQRSFRKLYSGHTDKQPADRLLYADTNMVSNNDTKDYRHFKLELNALTVRIRQWNRNGHILPVL